MTCSSAYHKISLYNVASRSCALVVLDLFLDYRCLYYTLPLDHPHSCYFKTSFKIEYSFLVIEILSFIFTSLASIFLHISPSPQQPLGPTHIFYTPTPSPSPHPLSLSLPTLLSASPRAPRSSPALTRRRPPALPCPCSFFPIAPPSLLSTPQVLSVRTMLLRRPSRARSLPATVARRATAPGI
jgi:hypothetical protein